MLCVFMGLSPKSIELIFGEVVGSIVLGEGTRVSRVFVLWVVVLL